jgi:hypothetical protein
LVSLTPISKTCNFARYKGIELVKTTSRTHPGKQLRLRPRLLPFFFTQTRKSLPKDDAQAPTPVFVEPYSADLDISDQVARQDIPCRVKLKRRRHHKQQWRLGADVQPWEIAIAREIAQLLVVSNPQPVVTGSAITSDPSQRSGCARKSGSRRELAKGDRCASSLRSRRSNSGRVVGVSACSEPIPKNVPPGPQRPKRSPRKRSATSALPGTGSAVTASGLSRRIGSIASRA